VAHMMSEPAFDQLRTKEQLGYIVHTATVKFSSYLAFRVIVQSNSKDGGYLDERIENFILGYRSTLELISDDDMQNNIKVIISYIYISSFYSKSKVYNKYCQLGLQL
jgi:insulysin